MQQHTQIHKVLYHLLITKTQNTRHSYTLSLHDALPIFAASGPRRGSAGHDAFPVAREPQVRVRAKMRSVARRVQRRSEEHTSELQSRRDLVCRLLLEKKKNIK